MSEWFAMNGYGKFIWPSFAVAIAVLIYNVLSARALLRNAQAEARRRVASQTSTETT